MKLTIKNLNKTIFFEENQYSTLLELLKDNNINIQSNCEGSGVCGKCHVSFDKKTYSKFDIEDFEYNVLDRLIDNTPTSRLACMVKVDNNLNESEIYIFNLDANLA